MTHPITGNNRPKSTAQTKDIPTLSDLISFDLPAIKLSGANENSFTFNADCTESELDTLRSAVMNSENMIHNGIAAIMDLLITIDIECSESADHNSRINALTLVHDLSCVLNALSTAEWLLGRATATKPQA